MGRCPTLLLFSCLVWQSAGWLSCMTFTCSNLQQNACASVAGDSAINLANSPCQDNYECRLQNVMTWFMGNQTTRTNILACTPVKEEVLGYDWPCESRQASKNLKSGQYPKQCLSDLDCQLMDGTSNTCVCTPRTSGTGGYCRPDVSSSYFQTYWDLCTLGGSTIYDMYEGYYWYLKIQYSVYYDVVDLPACKGNLWEFAELTRAQSELANAAALLWITAGLIVA